MQDRRRFFQIILFLAFGIAATLGIELTNANPLLVFLSAICLIFALVIAIAGWGESGKSEVPTSLKNKVSRQTFLENLSSSLGVPFMILGQGGRMIFISDALRKLFPHLQREDHYSSLARASNYVEAIRSALSGQEVSPFLFETHRGGDRVFEAVTSPIDLGKFGGMQGELLVEIIDRTDERRMDMMRRDFIANASHELRTPLAAIIGGIETINSDPSRDTVDHFLPIMSKEAERMRRLIEDLMSLSRVEMNEHYPPEETANLKPIVLDCLKALDARGELDHAKIDNQFSDDALVLGDYDQLQQVVMNILDNAIKYSGENPEIAISRVDNPLNYAGMIGLRISDNGPGIAAQYLPRLTERFYRVSVDQSRDKGGTGLGLAIVKHMIRRHRGQLQIESQIGHGSGFTIWLPAQ